MNFGSLLNQIMTSGQELYGKGEDAAAQKLGVGEDPAARGQMRNAALGGAAATAVLGLLLGTRSGRSITKAGVLAGGVGYLGKLAYDAYVKHSAAAASEAQPERISGPEAPITNLDGPAAETRAHALLAAMVAAAKSDGHISAEERGIIEGRLSEMGEDARAALAAELDKPIDAQAIAALADSEQAAREIYAMSALVCGADHPMERAYLDSLAAALGLPDGVKGEIEAQIAA
ncbi:tellurite resistance TerB family protein [Rubrimonas cliftonensis]|uniref:Uncharacterized membrane protein YebE, DUF533 family n=1 Tax=Rubrimonas cliftonensis TaxID=89524 RepID=A0A1H3X8V2_9RHOB|nr:DUF533 domain-containing protein [Rubrimonas cliftonensis]SDZ95670.1 Uncharacterized membrane protein YebE, DUF533 family [Rubrimonas cliftonensis]